ncbi:MAG: ATP synthase F1 subunit epsilon [Bacteroidales bacterium]|nr:ATP synthase F1 subunit epsilon [Bacteroidales bacterium]
MNIEILSVSGTIFSGQVSSVSVPGISGAFTILKQHAPILSLLSPGDVYVETKDNKKLSFEVKGGVVEVKKNKIIVLSE